MHQFCGNCGKPLGPDARCAVCGWTAPAAAVPGVPKAASPVLAAVQQKNVSAPKNAAKKQSPKAVGISKKKKNILPVIISIAVVLTGLIVVFALNCYYYDDSMSAVVITGTAFFDFAGDYKGMYFDGDFSGSRELPDLKMLPVKVLMTT